MKKIFSMCIAFIMLTISVIDCFAISIEPVENLIKTSYIGNTEVKEIDASGMRSINGNQFISDDIKIKQIFNGIGVKNIEYSGIYNELVADIGYIGAIISSSSYYEINDKNGTVRQIDKSEYISKSKVEQNAKSGDSSAGSETESSNGYMLITTSAIAKTNEALGTYNVISYYEWLETPITRSIDGISIASDNITWDMSNSDSYSAVMIAPYRHWNGTITTNDIFSETKTSPDGIYSNGFYYSFDLPNDVRTLTRVTIYEGISMIVYGKGRVDNYDDGTQMLWINSKYAHLQIKGLLSVEFGWEYGSYPGVTISQGSLMEKDYHNYLSWDYNLHYNFY